MYYIALFSVFIPLFAVYFWGWLVPHMGLPLWASLCMVVSLATQYACTYVPEIEGAKAKIHRLLAGISALLLIPVVSAVVLAKLHMGQAVVTAMLALLIMVGVFVLVMLQRRNVRHTLVAQIVYFAAFFVAVLEWFE